jgi:hypothetical protein
MLSLYGITLQQLDGKIAAANRSLQAGQLRDGGKQIGRPYTAPRALGVLTQVLHDTHAGLATYLAEGAGVPG